LLDAVDDRVFEAAMLLVARSMVTRAAQWRYVMACPLRFVDGPESRSACESHRLGLAFRVEEVFECCKDACGLQTD
jgi:hypothetical protein